MLYVCDPKADINVMKQPGCLAELTKQLGKVSSWRYENKSIPLHTSAPDLWCTALFLMNNYRVPHTTDDGGHSLPSLARTGAR